MKMLRKGKNNVRIWGSVVREYQSYRIPVIFYEKL